MTRDEAIKAMSEGKKVRHRYFGKDEWVTKSSNGLLTFEDGCSVSSELFYSGMIGKKNIGMTVGK